MNTERIARLFVVGLGGGLLLAALIASKAGPGRGGAIELHGRMAETGGWTPSDLTATVGEPLRLRLTSDDVMHGFAVGQTNWPAVDVKPGEVTEITLTFDHPGPYTFYCTRWCGLNHWRMRGTLEVSGPAQAQVTDAPPLYVTLGRDIDAPHPAPPDALPGRKPSAARGAGLGAPIPTPYLVADYYRAHSPLEVWQSLRTEALTRNVTDADVWDLVAVVWKANTRLAALNEGKQLYAANCAACHGENGAGDGVMAAALKNQLRANAVRGVSGPANFADATKMLGASPALLQGKLIRGGMGTGMPYWGPIFTEAQTWVLVDYLYTFQFEMEAEP